MNFDLFDRLTPAEAEKFLESFLNMGGRTHHELAREIASEDIVPDFSLKSIVPVLSWLLRKVKITAKKENEVVPDWIRNSEIYRKSLIEFENDSKHFVLYAAFYFGQSMVGQSKLLRWTTGNLETAEKNMPVVTGFKVSEMAPILIIENLFLRILREPNRVDDIKTAIHLWSERIPN